MKTGPHLSFYLVWFSGRLNRRRSANVVLFCLNDFFSWPAAIKFLQLIGLQGASIAGAGLVPFGLTQKEPKGQGLFSLSAGLH